MPAFFQQPSGDSLPATIVFGIVLLNLVVVALVAIYNYRKLQTAQEAWQQLSMRAGLSFQPGSFMKPPNLSGEFRRRHLVLDSFTRRSGRSQTRYTRVTLALRMGIGGNFNLQSRGFMAGVGRMLGMQDVPTGSERFDATFVVRGKPPELVRTAFSDLMLQNALTRLREHARFTLELSANTLTYTERGLPTDPDYLSEVFNTMSDLADRLDGGSKSSLF